MKKLFSVLTLIAVLSAITPAFAAPPGGPGGPGHGGQTIHAGAHYNAPHRVPPPPPVYHRRPHGSFAFYGNYARQGCWGCPCYNTLGWYNNCYYPPYNYYPASGAGFYLSF